MYTIKKSLGQHFLKDELIIQKIVEALKANPLSRLLEVGPGAGALTKELIKFSDIDFKAVELDREKVDYLHKKYEVLTDREIIMNPFKYDIDTIEWNIKNSFLSLRKLVRNQKLTPYNKKF